MPAFSRLRRRFSNKPNVIQTRQGTERLPFKSFHPHWIVGRGLSMYRSEDFGNVPRNKRRAALDLKLPLWSPFASTGHHCVWEGGKAMVWFWDADAVPATSAGPAHADPDDNPDTLSTTANSRTQPRMRPETVFLRRLDDGVVLQPCREGFELQHWRDPRARTLLLVRATPRTRPASRERPRAMGHTDAQASQLTQPHPAIATSATDPQASASDLTHEPWSSTPTPPGVAGNQRARPRVRRASRSRADRNLARSALLADPPSPPGGRGGVRRPATGSRPHPLGPQRTAGPAGSQSRPGGDPARTVPGLPHGPGRQAPSPARTRNSASGPISSANSRWSSGTRTRTPSPTSAPSKRCRCSNRSRRNRAAGTTRSR